MRDHFRSLRSREAVIHRPIEVVRNLRDLARGDQCADSDEAPIAWRESRTQLQITEQNMRGELHEPWSDRASLLLDTGGALRLGGLINREKFR